MFQVWSLAKRISFTFFFICFYAAFAHCWARLFFLSSVAKPGFFVLWVLKERNDTCSFRLERSHDKRAETPDWSVPSVRHEIFRDCPHDWSAGNHSQILLLPESRHQSSADTHRDSMPTVWKADRFREIQAPPLLLWRLPEQILADAPWSHRQPCRQKGNLPALREALHGLRKPA